MRNLAVNGISLLVMSAAAPIDAQDLFSKWPIQIHGFASQGFVKSNVNNYLTMPTREGSFALTDAGFNATSQLTRRLRVGAQVYTRNIGTLGNWRPTLDWAVADFRITEWLGARGGKVKTVFGLYTDSQDMESLHTWAILPQSLYPLDLRSSTMAHLGGDLWGDVSLGRRLGHLSYTAYAGRRLDDRHGGYRYVARQAGVRLDEITGWMSGVDLRWSSAQRGITAGASFLWMPFSGHGRFAVLPVPVSIHVHRKSYAGFVDYLRGDLHLTAEFTHSRSPVELSGVPGLTTSREDSLGWYGSAAYRLHPKLEVGGYHSRFISETTRRWSDPDNHIYDTAVTVRFDFNRHWSVKAEGHFMDGYGNNFSARGFYRLQNPDGYVRRTNLFVLRTGYIF